MGKVAGSPDPDSSERKRRLEEWFRSFVPTETAIDGGLYPDRLGDGMVGFDYAKFKLAGRPAQLPAFDADTSAEMERLFGGDIPDKQQLSSK